MPDVAPAGRRLARLLKGALRAYGFRCIRVEVVVAPIADENQAARQAQANGSPLPQPAE